MEKLTTSFFGKKLPNLRMNFNSINSIPYQDKNDLLHPFLMALDELYKKVTIFPIKNKKNELSGFRVICFDSKIKVIKEHATTTIVTDFILGVLNHLSTSLNYKIKLINYKEVNDLVYEIAQGDKLIYEWKKQI